MCPASSSPAPSFQVVEPLKRDLFGRIELGRWGVDAARVPAVRRAVGAAPWWSRPLAVWLARRELAVLRALPACEQWPALLGRDRQGLVRSYLDGRPMDAARPRDPRYFAQARRLLTALHRAGVTHDDLAKEQNWLVLADGRPALLDFQLARFAPRRGRLFRLLGREDLRHLLKHKRSYCPEALTPRECALLASPSGPARWVRRYVKPAYTLVTRRWLGWRDDEGRGSR